MHRIVGAGAVKIRSHHQADEGDIITLCALATDRGLHISVLGLTLLAHQTIVGTMDSLDQTGKDLDRIEQQLKLLLKQTQKLREENQSLQNRQESLVAERAGLVARNEDARSKVEAMIHRLKALEQS